MKKYPKNETKPVKYAKYVIVVPTKKDEKKLQDAFRYLHWLDNIDTNYITVNQLVHEYGNFNSIIVDPVKYKKIKKINDYEKEIKKSTLGFSNSDI